MNNPYLKTELKYFLHTFNRQPILIKKAKEFYVWDNSGRRYIDFYSGLAVCGVGHNNQRVVKAIQKQAGTLIHSSNFFYTPPQMALAKTLSKKWSGSRVFFSNSGAEANETMIKLARLWAHENKKAGRELITFHNSFHGRTLATLTASAGPNSQTKNLFRPLPAGFKSVPYNDSEKLKKAISKQTIGIMLELVQGEGGIHIASKDFLKTIQKICREKNILLLIDEIQSGMARTGRFFAFEHHGIKPDIVTLAKGLAGGMPLGATLANPRVSKWIKPGMHGSTFGGNPVACAASLEVLKLLTPAALVAIRKSANYIRLRLANFKRFSSVVSIRSQGLMIGIQLNRSGIPYVDLARKQGLLINCTQGTVLRFLPPYFMKKKDIDRALSILEIVFKKSE